MNPSQEAADIQRRMQQLREELNEEVEDLSQDARNRTKWDYYVRNYPWASMCLAMGLGYLIVPTRPSVKWQDASRLAELAKQDRLVVTATPQRRRSLGASVLAFVGSLLARRLLTYAGQRMGDLFIPPSGDSPQKSAVQTEGR